MEPGIEPWEGPGYEPRGEPMSFQLWYGLGNFTVLGP